MADLLMPGTTAPDFEGRDQDDNLIWLSAFAGRPVVLYFYPADETFGCTREACAFRDDLDGFRQLGAVVLGVSPQDAASHRAFRDRHGLNFPLIADASRSIITAYRANGLLGHTKRLTYVISPAGTILAAIRPADPKNHSREALRVLQEISTHGIPKRPAAAR